MPNRPTRKPGHQTPAAELAPANEPLAPGGFGPDGDPLSWDGSVVDRRMWPDRRSSVAADASALDRRRGPGRRRSDFTRSAEEGELTAEQFLFLMAIETFKKVNHRQFPTWTDVLEVVRLLGYRKTLPSELRLTSAEDWTERPDAPAAVRSARWADHAPYRAA